MLMQNETNTIPVFFSCDDNYLPFLAVAVRSLVTNARTNAHYRIIVLNNGLNEEMSKKIAGMATDNISISFVSVADKLAPLLSRLNLRDYYTASIYFRIFIPEMFPDLDKAIYLDSDIVLNSDIAKLFVLPLEDKLLGAVPDAVVAGRQEFRDYADDAVGVPYRKYFNSGVLLMNLKEMRKSNIEGRFAWLLNKYGFNTICPDQDYLNVLCRDRVHYLNEGWNKMAINRNYSGVPNLVHYNMFGKPWHYDNVPYEEYFWKYAKDTEFYEDILKLKQAFGAACAEQDIAAEKTLVASALAIIDEEVNFKNAVVCLEEKHHENRLVSLAAQA